MNYLAHLFLAGTEEEVIFGNLLEDFIHGRVEHQRNDHLSKRIKVGIRQHRLIDTFTDQHQLVKEVKRIFHQDFGRYDGIVVDVIFDHFLIKNWETFTSENFQQFRERIYQDLAKFEHLMPEPLLKLVLSMREHDWLANYEYDYGLERAFQSLNRKVALTRDLRLAVPLMHDHFKEINSFFIPFFHSLQEECTTFLKHEYQ